MNKLPNLKPSPPGQNLTVSGTSFSTPLVLEQGVWKAGKGQKGGTYEFSTGLTPLDISELETEWIPDLHDLYFRHVENFARTNDPAVAQSFYRCCSDAHWSWSYKSMDPSLAHTDWYLLRIDNEIQGVSVIYQPHQAVEDGRSIYYIEYIAAAPWNRRNFFSPTPRFSPIGTSLLQFTQKYHLQAKGLRPGIGLHALPTAESFYTDLGMQVYPGYTKGIMNYLEMSENVVQSLLAGRSS